MKTREIARAAPRQRNEPADPVLQMLGVGRDLWAHESGDRMVDRLRSEESPALSPAKRGTSSGDGLHEAIWSRIGKHQGQQFHTARGLPVTFKIEGNGIWFFRNGKRIERKATRTQVDEAISRCPLKSTTEIADLMDYAYLFAILMDKRIRGDAW
jgi:hypothetical protein